LKHKEFGSPKKPIPPLKTLEDTLQIIVKLGNRRNIKIFLRRRFWENGGVFP
jgi:hypothetical protein